MRGYVERIPSVGLWVMGRGEMLLTKLLGDREYRYRREDQKCDNKALLQADYVSLHLKRDD